MRHHVDSVFLAFYARCDLAILQSPSDFPPTCFSRFRGPPMKTPQASLKQRYWKSSVVYLLYAPQIAGGTEGPRNTSWSC